MPEVYVGIKYEIDLQKGERETKHADELIKWCKAFYARGLVSCGGNVAGNLSTRTKKGFLITPGGQKLGEINAGQLVEIVEVDEKAHKLKAIGIQNPSSESFLHAAIYKAGKDVNAILHGHNERVTADPKKFGVPETESERPYGTLELRDEVLKILGKNKLVQMKNHGFIAMGKDIEEAGKIAMELYKKSNPENCK
ncbi:MAG: class II aldolase/adducin family protein [Candidatus Diapherotrites archaeon]|nr:class II aldolase/adducin family protein [Candidatus Diapherotrites archaeon]